MSWFKDIFIDVLVTFAIISAVFVSSTLLDVVIIGYTAILLTAKAVILFGDDSLNLLNKTKTEAPIWLSHLLYGTNTVVLLYFGWWYTGSAWAVIWILSYMAHRRLRRRQGSPAS